MLTAWFCWPPTSQILSSKLLQRGQSNRGIHGFLPEDIKKEAARASRKVRIPWNEGLGRGLFSYLPGHPCLGSFPLVSNLEVRGLLDFPAGPSLKFHASLGHRILSEEREQQPGKTKLSAA